MKKWQNMAAWDDPVQGQKLDLIRVGPFLFRIFYNSFLFRCTSNNANNIRSFMPLVFLLFQLEDGISFNMSEKGTD